MKQTLFKYLQEGSTMIPMGQVALNFLVALVLGMVVYLSYRFSHSRAVYSARFNVSLVMLTIVSTMVMSVIGNNIALSLGMVGALSIVRFRTAIKDPRDTVYIFWCIVVGICCGVSEYVIASFGTGIIFLFLLIFGYVKSNNRYLLIIHGSSNVEEEVEKSILIHYDGNAKLRVKNTTSDRVEYIFELSEKVIEKSSTKELSINKILYNIDGINSVNIVCQNEDINQ